MPSSGAFSWGRAIQSHHHAVPVRWRNEPLAIPVGLTALTYGLGRSYGDSCLNDGGALLTTRDLNRFMAFDRDNGILCCEAGVSLAEILDVIVPSGWFLPVTPGTKHVTLGGAIANDVHGKNHHGAGTLGCHVRRFELLRSDGTRMICSATENADWFQATIGGLGLTGLVTWAEVALRPIASAFIAMESVRFRTLDEFFPLNRDSEERFEYTVSWIDALATGSRTGRGYYFRGNHAGSMQETPSVRRGRRLRVPFDLAPSVLNSQVLRAFNAAYYHHQLRRLRRAVAHFDPFFYPLDGIDNWNRLYGRRGFFQYQCVVPFANGVHVVRELLATVTRSSQASFLTVLKSFGARRSPGWLSFPRAGFTLAIDFPNRGETTLQLFDRLDGIVVSAGGAVYPAKDARMSPATFRRSFPGWERMIPYIDPRFSSSFWRRVTADHERHAGVA